MPGPVPDNKGDHGGTEGPCGGNTQPSFWSSLIGAAVNQGHDRDYPRGCGQKSTAKRGPEQACCSSCGGEPQSACAGASRREEELEEGCLLEELD